MLVVGELINSSRKKIAKAVREKDADYISKIARDQADAGASYIDVNAGIFEDDEPACLTWLVEVVQQAIDLPCCIDSPNPKAIEAALKVHKGTPLLNSISLEKDRFDAVLPFVKGTDNKIIALAIGEDGMPTSADDRIANARRLVGHLKENGVPLDNIHVDLLAEPISSNSRVGTFFLEALNAVTAEFPEVHTICGASNVSYGLPKRKLMNQVFVVMGVAMGLDSCIANPLDRKLMANLVAAETLAGRDEFCERYLNAYRDGLFSN
jgi:5-methyltetrahydrofolate--homocysteine methyltransferase